jgi:para-aminobenzoate synthetase/4-amino-4-deoxychorismate lyase
MAKIKPQITRAHKNEVLLKDNDTWLHFSAPRRLIVAERLEDVLPALHEIERQVESNGWHAAGFLSYEAASAFDPALRTRPKNGFPYLWFGLYPESHAVQLPDSERPQEFFEWHPTVDRETYNSAIAQIKDHIAHGKTYQVNYTMRLQTDFSGSAWNFFLHLAQTQNHYAAYIDLGRYVICCASPELFLQLDGSTITCRPMKGTTSRGRTTAEDQMHAKWLKNSEKNRAENVMIVDMIRNDLGRVAETGSINVPQLFQTERYPTLWQMTSTVTAITNSSFTDILTALFPSASITGAPKVSTMNIIAELEGTPRKIYTGAIGYFAPGRKAKFNVAIRTALIDQKRHKAEYGVGGGIVWDSTSTDEYAEALLKARVLMQQTLPFSLLETILWTPEKKYFLYEKHIKRMLDSADYFDIHIMKQELEEYFEQISSKFRTAQRVRVMLDRDGKLSHESHSFDLQEKNRLLKTSLARGPIDSKNIFLFHKTTVRDTYESARVGLEEFDDVLLYNEKGNLTEFTIGNLVVELEGQLFTPPLSCGVLAGTFRAHLLETGGVVERAISVQQLTRCTKVFRINSIRCWQEVELPR